MFRDAPTDEAAAEHGEPFMDLVTTIESNLTTLELMHPGKSVVDYRTGSSRAAAMLATGARI